MSLTWYGAVQFNPRGYVCGHCGRNVGPAIGFYTKGRPAPSQAFTYICSFCHAPTYFDSEKRQFPGAPVGNDVSSVPQDVAVLYAEARSCVTVNSFTAAVMTCRKLLMHLAVEKGAPVGKSFLEYIEYLSEQNYIPPNRKGWVDHIRSKGNEANHEIKIMSEADAEDLIAFSEMLLEFIYEFPTKVPPPAPAQGD